MAFFRSFADSGFSDAPLPAKPDDTPGINIFFFQLTRKSLFVICINSSIFYFFEKSIYFEKDKRCIFDWNNTAKLEADPGFFGGVKSKIPIPNFVTWHNLNVQYEPSGVKAALGRHFSYFDPGIFSGCGHGRRNEGQGALVRPGQRK